MVQFTPVQYRNKSYPDDIDPVLKELPAHFDSKESLGDFEYSLHTEYSYGKRKFTSPFVQDLPTIKKCAKKGVPQLWYNERWVCEFVVFLKGFVGQNRPLRIIEIHPPFRDYCASLAEFGPLYTRFEAEMRTVDLRKI